MSLSLLFKVSRFRFWHYVLGPMLVFFAASYLPDSIRQSFSNGGTDRIFQSIVLLIILGYFTFPANLWIYGRNDIADRDTDKLNIKKGTYEASISDSTRTIRKLKQSIWLWNIGYIVVGVLLCVVLMLIADCFPLGINGHQCSNIVSQPRIIFSSVLVPAFSYALAYSILLLLPFLVTSYVYSRKPLRAKSKPFLDGIMNILYITTPFTFLFFIYFLTGSQTGQELLSLVYVFIAAWFRVIAMHCYSAIPDIDPDAKAGVTTTAVYLGKQQSLVYCGILYLLSALFAFPSLGRFSIIGGAIYISVIIFSYYKDNIFGLYKLFPYINLIIGFLLFRYVLLVL